MKNEDTAIWFIVITITLLYLYNTGRLAAIRKVIDDATYKANFGLSQGIKITQIDTPGSSPTDIFQSVAGGLASIVDIAGLFA